VTRATTTEPMAAADAPASPQPRLSRHRRPTRPPRGLAAEMYRWAEVARHEPLWAVPGDRANPSRRKPGRPSRLNPEVVATLLTAVRAGNFRETAAELAGVAPATMYRWLRDPRPPFVALRAALERVEAEVEVEVVANLVRLSRTSTAAAVFWLERRHPERWSIPQRLPEVNRHAQVDGYTTQSSPVYIDLSTVLTPELVARLPEPVAGGKSDDDEF
jgi:hypothetical protein